MSKIIRRIPDVRGELFGLTIISIIIFHFCDDVTSKQLGGAADLIATLYMLAIGSIGVDIFLFLSGMGLFYSMSGDPRVLSFYRKRIIRILPTYLLLGGAGWLVLDIFVNKGGFLQFLYDFSMLSFWADGVRTVWYIAFILAMYLLFPLLYRLVALSSRRIAGAGVFVLIGVVIAACLALYFFSPEVYENLEIALWRIVPFVIGAWYGRCFRRNESIAVESIILSVLAVVFGALFIFTRYNPEFLGGIFYLRLGILFYPFPVLFAATALLVLCKGSRFLRSVGAASLELYLSHVLIRAVMRDMGMPIYQPLYFLIYLALSVVLSYAIHKLFSICFNRKSKKSK